MKAAPIRNVDARVVRKIRCGEDGWRMTLRFGGRFGAIPGQFVHVRVAEADRPLLRRPFSVWNERRAGKGTELDILFNVVGVGTRELERRKVGDRVRVMGPLGTGFVENPRAHTYVFVAGGVGIVPFYMFKKRLAASRRVVLLFGGRRAGRLYGIRDFRRLGVEVHAATDDGSAGRHGLVTELLPPFLTPGHQIYVCGPEAMANRAILMAREAGVPCQASLEKHMGCALGACGACVTKVRDLPAEAGKSAKAGDDDWRWSRICIEGPCYDAAQLVVEA